MDTGLVSFSFSHFDRRAQSFIMVNYVHIIYHMNQYVYHHYTRNLLWVISENPQTKHRTISSLREMYHSSPETIYSYYIVLSRFLAVTWWPQRSLASLPGYFGGGSARKLWYDDPKGNQYNAWNAWVAGGGGGGGGCSGGGNGLALPRWGYW